MVRELTPAVVAAEEVVAYLKHRGGGGGGGAALKEAEEQLAAARRAGECKAKSFAKGAATSIASVLKENEDKHT